MESNIQKKRLSNQPEKTKEGGLATAPLQIKYSKQKKESKGEQVMKIYVINPESNQIVCETPEEAYEKTDGRIDLEAIREMKNGEILTDGTETGSRAADLEIICTEE